MLLEWNCMRGLGKNSKTLTHVIQYAERHCHHRNTAREQIIIQMIVEHALTIPLLLVPYTDRK